MASQPTEPISATMRAMAQGAPGLDADALETCFVMRRVVRSVVTTFDQYLARHGMSLRRFGVLVALQSQPAGLHPAELADQIGVSRATITGFADSLERAGLVERERYPGDRRMVSVRITPRGRKLVAELLPDHMRRMTRAMGNLNRSERRTLRSLMKKISSAVEAMRKGGPAQGG